MVPPGYKSAGHKQADVDGYDNACEGHGAHSPKPEDLSGGAERAVEDAQREVEEDLWLQGKEATAQTLF
jgi:hypothetical protein